eukprot:1921198-Alexandrium_andersonii.AAC.1
MTSSWPPRSTRMRSLPSAVRKSTTSPPHTPMSRKRPRVRVSPMALRSSASRAISSANSSRQAGSVRR